MNLNTNLPPGCRASDLERPLRDVADMMDALFERLDDWVHERRNEADEQHAEQERAFNEGIREGIERRCR